jgi:predicted acetyltransferase/predicted GNAT family N-acyltransferase
MADEAEFIAMHGEFMASGGRIHPGVIKLFKGDFSEYLKEVVNAESGRRVGYVPCRIMLMKDDTGRIFGMVSLRFELNDYLFRYGGHIGYGVRPSERGKGYGTIQLKLALEEMRKRGIYRVLITCDKDNPASAKVIQNCGGVLENEVTEDDGEIVQRYWIDLPEIVRVTEADLPECLAVIRASFATVAKEFGLNEQNCPTHRAFMKMGHLKYIYDSGIPLYYLRTAGKIAGFCELNRQKAGEYRLGKLAVLPEFRHNGYGRMLIDHCKTTAATEAAAEGLQGVKILISIIEENTVLKEWYAGHGFVHTGTKKFEHQPFTAGFMEWNKAD